MNATKLIISLTAQKFRLLNRHKYNVMWHQNLRLSNKKKQSLFSIDAGNVVMHKKQKIPKASDIVIIGGGIYGSSIAYWLKQRAPESFSVLVIEKDPTFSQCCTTLSVGGIRQQFSLPENIQLSLASAEFLRNVKRHLSIPGEDPPEIQYQPNGYLFLANEAKVEQFKENIKLQKELGAKVELLTARQLKENFPWINTDGIAMASFGLENEGRFDPHSLLSAFQKKAISYGTAYVKGEVIGFNCKKVNEMYVGEEDPFLSAHHLLLKTDDGEIREIEFSMLVIAAGAESGEVAKLLNIGTGSGILQTALPVHPRKRYVYFYHCPDGPVLDFPMMIDPSGTYAVREGIGGYYLAGKSPNVNEEPNNSNLDVDYQYFDKCVWPVIANRVPAFEAVKVKSGWAGYYDYNYFDQNGIIGSHPYYGNIYFATGFSGHGIQMAPAVGRAIMELIVDKEFISIDLSRFGFERLISGIPLDENHCV